MKKVFGYLIAFLGLLVLASNSAIARQQVEFLAGIDKLVLLIPGLVLVCLGVVILIVLGGGSSKGGKVKHVSEEVPIYKGEGKKRRIVGYKSE
tara:strand:- start:986 stop:1264 length:279 start_codon:yes stop_codon:yes gene_type:complete